MIGRRAFLGGALAATGCGGAAMLELASVGPRARRVVRVGRGAIALEVGLRAAPTSMETLARWARRAGAMIEQYAGFPARRVPVRLVTGGPTAVAFGQHTRDGRILLLVGAATDREALRRDPILVHELAHAAFPRLARRHRWMREGLSTYLETLLRAKAGVIDAPALWGAWRRSMPRGLPRPGDRGLDRARSWASTYWGGALFWLLVDVELHARGRSLADVLRAVMAAGGDDRVRWPVRRVLEVGDAATGTDVLSARYAAMARRPARPDLDGLFAGLGARPGAAALVDDAPRAGLRRRIEAVTLRLPPI